MCSPASDARHPSVKEIGRPPRAPPFPRLHRLEITARLSLHTRLRVSPNCRRRSHLRSMPLTPVRCATPSSSWTIPPLLLDTASPGGRSRSRTAGRPQPAGLLVAAALRLRSSLVSCSRWASLPSSLRSGSRSLKMVRRSISDHAEKSASD